MAAKEKKPAGGVYRYGLWSKWYVKNGVLYTDSGSILHWQKRVALTRVVTLRSIALGPFCLVQLYTPAGVIHLPLVRPGDRPVLMAAWEQMARR